MIAWQRGGEKAPFAPTVGRLDELENGPVYHITTPRSEHATAVERVERIIRYPEGYESEEVAEETFDSMWSRVDAFNADISQIDETLEQQYPLGDLPPLHSTNLSVLVLDG